MSLRLHLFVSDVDPENKDFMCKRVGAKISYAAPGMERFSLDLPQVVKKRCTLKLGCGGVWNFWLQATKSFF